VNHLKPAPVTEPRDRGERLAAHDLDHRILAVATDHGVDGVVGQHRFGHRLRVDPATHDDAVRNRLLGQPRDPMRGNRHVGQDGNADEPGVRRPHPRHDLGVVESFSVHVQDLDRVSGRLNARSDRQNAERRQAVLKDRPLLEHRPGRIDQEKIDAIARRSGRHLAGS
jgi:hypothetical protein